MTTIAANRNNRVSLKTWIGVFGTVLGAFMAVLDIQITLHTSIANRVRQQAYIQAFNDCFYFIAIALLVSGIAVVFLKKVKASGMSAAH